LEPGPTPVDPGPTDAIPGEVLVRVLKDLRAHPDAFVAVATMPIVDAVTAATDLWRHGVDAAFVRHDDPIIPADPEFDPEAASEPWDDPSDDTVAEDAGEVDSDLEWPSQSGAGEGSAWGWGEGEEPHWTWESGDGRDPREQNEEAGADRPDADDEHKDVDEDTDPEPPSAPPIGLERTRPAVWVPGLRRGALRARAYGPMADTVVLFVRTEDEDEARRVAGRRIGVL
jgi:hypothetical protein